MSIHEIIAAANRTCNALPGVNIITEESGSGRNFHLTIKLPDGEEYFESGTPQYLLGFLKGFTAKVKS